MSSGYIKKMQTLGVINNIEYSSLSKCQICATSKLTRKTCGSVTRETKLLELIQSDQGDLRQTMTRGGKKFYVTFIDDFLGSLDFTCLQIKMKHLICSYVIKIKKKINLIRK